MSIGIIGAGISGLTLAYELQQQGAEYQLWEAADRPGGYIQSRREVGPQGQSYLRELGPNSLLGDAAMLDWLDKLGLTPELIFSNPVSKVRFVFRAGRYRPLPSTPPSLLFGSFFSWKTKLAIFRERTNRTTSPPGETLAQFFRRRFSPEIVEYALNPFVAGIYAGDPDQLLVAETFPILLQYEKEHGSVLRGLIKSQSAKAGGALGRRQSFSFREGMQSLSDALAASLTQLSLNDPVHRIERSAEGWRVESRLGTKTVDRLVFALSTDAAAQLLDRSDLLPEFAAALRRVEYPPMTVVHSVYKRADVRHPLDGFGGLNPKTENRFAAGHLWSSSVFTGRCPDDEVLFTSFVGGRQGEREPGLNNACLPDDVISERVHDELADSFGIAATVPVFRTVFRWERAIPQYNADIVTVRQFVDRIEADNLRVCANWYGGLSLSDCLRKAQQMANQLVHTSSINKF